MLLVPVPNNIRLSSFVINLSLSFFFLATLLNKMTSILDKNITLLYIMTSELYTQIVSLVHQIVKKEEANYG